MAKLSVRPAADPDRCRGKLDGVAPRKTRAWRAFGWAWDVAAGAPAKAISLFDNGRFLGLAAAGQQRPDVPAALPVVTASAVGWDLDIARRPERLQVVATLADGSTCAVWTAP